jgi:hypothetical protein
MPWGGSSVKRKSILIALLMLLACWPSLHASESEERVFKVSGPANVSLSNISGDTKIETWDRNEVRVIAQKSSDEAETNFSQTGDRIRIETKKEKVSYQITTPRSTNLDVYSVSGGLAVSGVSGKTEVATVSGNLQLESITGSVLAKTVSGKVMLHRCQADSISVGSVSGSLQLEEISGRVDAKSVSGKVWLSKANCTRTDVVTTSGEIIYEGRIVKGGNYTLHTHSGQIQIVLPADSSFEVGASSFSGKFDSEFPLKFLEGTEPREHSKFSFRATYGNGEAVLELKTFSGGIKLKKQ